MFKGLSNAVRFLAIDQVANANSGHLGMPLGMSECLTVLFKNIMKFDPQNPTWPNRDRFVMSGGHGSAALYALLHLTGYKDFPLSELKNFRKLGSKASGHPEYQPESGIETTTGPLGQGIANAVGMAIEERLLNARLGDDCINHYTYVVAGEGDLMEGVAYEACSLAGHLSLGHLIVLFDKNNITIDGKTDVSCSTDVRKLFEAMGWQVLETDGYHEEEITNTILQAQTDLRPSLIICNTIIGYGTPRAGMPSAHSGALTPSEREYACKFFDWPHAAFEIPEYTQRAWLSIGHRNHETCEKWYVNQSRKYDLLGIDAEQESAKALRSLKKEYFLSRPFAATRTFFNQILERLTAIDETLISGSCDLGSSTGCKNSGAKAIQAKDFSGNYINYGIREHAMGSIMNGIAAGKKIKCCGGTFLVFSDYMKPAIRMAAFMKIPVMFVFSHDSIGVGEDGPTHQPVEQLAMLRSIPNLQVFRPADAIETVECVELALQSKLPSAMILTRQSVLSVRFSDKKNLCATGGYLLNDDITSEKAQFTIIATGSEVGIALELKKMFNNAGFFGNVLNMPCFELFDQQPKEYKQRVLGNSLRIGIEASNGFGWEKYLGSNGIFFGVKGGFGVSCPGKEAYKHFKLTAEDIFNSVIDILRKR